MSQEEPSKLEGLLAAAAGGDQGSFKGLYEATAAKLYGIILRICRDRGLSDEILQETYVKVWRSAARYDRLQGRPITWMATIARNTAIDAVRRKSEVRLQQDADEDFDPFANVPDSTTSDFDTGDLMALRACLERLDADQRQCVLLAYYQGYSRDELASRFDRPVGTIKTWLHRGLASLKDCLQ